MGTGWRWYIDGPELDLKYHQKLINPFLLINLLWFLISRHNSGNDSLVLSLDVMTCNMQIKPQAACNMRLHHYHHHH